MRTLAVVRPALITITILAIPSIMMALRVEGWDWGILDFVIMGGLLFGAGLVYEFLSKNARSAKQRGIIAAAVLAVVLLIWVELAVDAVSRLVEFIFTLI